MSRLVPIVLLSFLAILAFASLSGCVTAPDSAEKTTVRLGYVPIPQNTLTILAIKKGFFAEEGISIEETKASFVGNIFQALAQNQLDVLVGAETPGMFMAMKGGAYTVIGQTAQTKNDSTLLVKTDSGISKLTDLSGRKVGLVLTSTSHYNLWKSLEAVGVDPHDVEFSDLAPANMAAALDKGDVDAIFQWEPIPFKIQKEFKEKVTSIPIDSSWIVVIYTSSEYSAKNDSIKRLLTGWKKAELFLKEHPEESATIVGNELGLSPEDLKSIWSKMEFEIAPFTQEHLFSSQAQWAIDTKIIADAPIPNFHSRIHNHLSSDGSVLP